jgi:mono/diheme cytochrome c family protein
MFFKKTLPFCILASFLVMTTSASALELKFKGKSNQLIEQSKLIQNKNASGITIFEPHRDELVTYVGLPFNQLMDDVFGEKWHREEEILFTCIDGYQPSIPVSKFKRFKAWIVWARKDGKPFEIVNTLQASEKVDLGPLYLVWDNQKEQELLEGGASDFPYQIASIDLISFKDKFPKLAPPVGSSADVTEGFLLYRKYCMTCHAIDGEGGQKAPDLKLTNAMARIPLKELRRWILSPDKVKPGTKMPPFAPKLPNREKAVDPLINYLKVILAPGNKPR